jgi:hypothetical protein
MNATIARKISKYVVDANPEFVQHPSVTTENDTPTVLTTIELPEYVGGILEVRVIAFKDDGSLLNTWVYLAKVRKTTTLTIGTPVPVMEDDTDLAATVSIINESEDIGIQGTGALTDNIIWKTETKLSTENATSIP